MTARSELERRRAWLDKAIAGLEQQRAAVRQQLAALGGYRIALRPDVTGEDPLDPATRLDDIVVMRPTMFRAEQLDASTWWVACYLDDGADRICWNVSASARPKRLDWRGYEYPDPGVIYEHELRNGAG